MVYMALFSYMGEDSTCFPSVAAIAKGTGLAERTVRYRLGELDQLGVIERQHPRPGMTAVYLLHPPWTFWQLQAIAPHESLHGVQGSMPHSPQQPLHTMQGSPPKANLNPCMVCTPPLHAVQGTPAHGAAEVTQGSNPRKKPNERVHRPRRNDRTLGPPKITPEAHQLAKRFYDHVWQGKPREQVPSDWYMRQAGQAQALLKHRPVVDWLCCLEWALSDPFWRVKLANLHKLSDPIWTQFAQAGALVTVGPGAAHNLAEDYVQDEPSAATGGVGRG